MKFILILAILAVFVSVAAADNSGKNDMRCATCELVIAQIDNLIGDEKTEEAIIAAVERVCEYIPYAGFVKPCEAIIEQYGKQIIGWLINEADPDHICTLIGQCKKAQELSSGDNDVKCAVCEYVVSVIDNQLADEHTEEEIIAVVEKVCDFLPQSFRKPCDAMIEEYGEEIIRWLVAEMDPDYICGLVGLCKRAETPVPAQTGEYCTLCKAAIGWIESKLSDKPEEEEVEQLLEKVCQYVPGSMKGECDALIENYYPLILNYLVQRFDSETICNLIGLCKATEATVHPAENFDWCPACKFVVGKLEEWVVSKSTEEEIVHYVEKVCKYAKKHRAECEALIEQSGAQIIEWFVNRMNPQVMCAALKVCKTKVESPENFDWCPACKFVVGKLEEWVVSKSTEEEIVHYVEKVCKYAKKYRSECEALIEQDGPKIIEWFVHRMNPEVMCTAFKVCKAKAAPAPVNDMQCATCELLVSQVDSMLQDNATEQEIIFAVEHVCEYAPAPFQKPCEALVEEYGPMVINWLVAEMDPDRICTLIGLCKHTAAPVEENAVNCPMCTMAIGWLESQLSAKPTEEEVEQLLEKVCSVVGTYEKTCDAFIEQYYPKLVEYLVQRFDSKTICSLLGLCKPTEEVPVTDQKCASCMLAVSFVEGQLKDKATEEEICSRIFNGSIHDVCMVYLPQLIGLLDGREKQICSYVGMC